jgi:hypothetical protein
MTDVAGPLGPLGRPSSLPILGMEATRSDAADDSMVEDGCNMVLVFEIPTGKPDSDQPMVPTGAIVRFLGKLSGSPLPAGADPFAGSITRIWDRTRLAASAQTFLGRAAHGT